MDDLPPGRRRRFHHQTRAAGCARPARAVPERLERTAAERRGFTLLVFVLGGPHLQAVQAVEGLGQDDRRGEAGAAPDQLFAMQIAVSHGVPRSVIAIPAPKQHAGTAA